MRWQPPSSPPNSPGPCFGPAVSRLYLDYCATAPLKPVAQQAMLSAMAQTGNASSVHADGRSARRVIEDSREAVARMVGCAPARVIFTSGGTEANNLALRSRPGLPILASAIEHDSVLGAAGDSAIHLPVDAHGVLNLAACESRLRALPDGVSFTVAVMLVNNETGAIQPVSAVAERVHARGGLLHVDAVQAAGKMPLDLDALGADTLALSAHKLGGPAGVGALVVRNGLELPPLLAGGGQERGRRAGTENRIGIAGFGAVAAAVAEELALVPTLTAWRDRLEAAATAACPGVRTAAANAPRAGHVSCLILPGMSGETQVMALDLAGIAVSAGAACSSGKARPSHVLAAMGEKDDAANAIRVSLGWATTAGDIDRFVAAYAAMAGRHGGRR